MFPKITSKYLVSVSALLLFLFMSSCDIYKSNETEISGVDKTVCEQFSDSIFTTVTAGVVSGYKATWSNAGLDTIIGALIDSLNADSAFIEQNHDPAYELTLGAGNDTSYVVLKAQSGTATIFVAQVVKMTLLGKDGTEIALVNEEMPLSTISGCTELDEGNKPQPVIKMRNEYDVNGGDLLLQLIKVEQTKSKVFRIAVQ